MSDDKKSTDPSDNPAFNPALVDDTDEFASDRKKLKDDEALAATSSLSSDEEAPIGWTINQNASIASDANLMVAGDGLTDPAITSDNKNELGEQGKSGASATAASGSEHSTKETTEHSPRANSNEQQSNVAVSKQADTPHGSELQHGIVDTGFGADPDHQKHLSDDANNVDRLDTTAPPGKQDSTPASQSPIGPPDFAVTPPQTETATEDKVVQLSGMLTVDSQRPVPGLTWHIANRDGTFGHIELTSDGHWSYVLNSASTDVQSLAEGQQVSETFLVTATDGYGTSRSALITLQVVGTNDAPTLLVPPLTVIEDQTVATGHIVGNDVDAGAILSYHCSASPPGFVLHTDGSYTFDPSNTAYQSLPAGQPLVLDIPVVVTDQHGASAQQNFRVTVIGTNDAPVMSVEPLAEIKEDSAVLHGKLSSTDADIADISIFSARSMTPGFVLHADGSYTFDPSNPAYQHLAEGESLDIKIPVSVMDAQGAIDTGEVMLRVVGTNDVPKLMAQPGFSVHEDDAVIKGQFTALDLDSSDTLTYSTPNPVHGLTLNQDGSYTFDPSDPAYQHLAPGDHVDLHIPVTVSDGHGGSATRILQITVNGTDDLPVIAATPKQSIVEDQTIQGQMLATDPDDGDKLTFTLPAPVDGLTVNPDGSYTFDASHSAYQHLQAGQKLDLSIPVSVADSHGQASLAVLHIGLTGSNDQAMVVGIDHAMGSVQDAYGGSLRIEGRLGALDLDSGESSFSPQLLQGTYGVLAIDASGKWTYSADASQQALRTLQGSQTLPEHFEVRTADGTTHDIALTIKGQNTHAVFGGVSTGLTKEDTVSVASGKMSVMDPNAGEASFTAIDQETAHGHFSLQTDGSWTFTLNNQNTEVQALAESTGMITERITVGSVDGTPHVVIVNIVGTNDQPMIGGTATGAVKEDDTADTISGTLIDGDVDTGAQQTWSVVGNSQGSYGSLAIDPKTGQWTYTIDNSLDATQQLAEGHPGTESFTVRVTDEHGATAMKTVVVTVNGSNDGPVVTAAASLPGGSEDVAVTVTTAQLIAHVHDVDQGETAQLSVHNLVVDHGSITDNGDGTYTVTPDANYNGNLHLTYDVQDPHGVKVSAAANMQLAAVNDAAVITGSGKATPDDDTAISGQLTVTDVDAGEDHFTAQTDVNGQYGKFSITADGQWTYIPDARADALGVGQAPQETFTVHSADGTSHDVVITVTGSSDLSLGGDTSGAASEDRTTTLSGDLTLTDETGSDTTPHFGDHILQGAYGSLDLRDQGHWIYNLNNQAANVQGLKDGQVVEERFHLTMPDGTTRDVVIQVTGTHDQPQIQAVDTKPPADLSAVVQVTEFTGATDLKAFQTEHAGVPVGTQIVGLYMPGSDHNLLDGKPLPTIHASYNTGNLAAAGSGFQYLDQNQWFGQNLEGGTERFKALPPSVRNNFDGGLVVFSDGSVGRLVKVCDDNRANGPGDYIYFNKIDGVNANTGVSLISGSAAAGETVEIYEGSHLLGTATADSNGHWQLGIPKLSDGDHNIHTEVNGVSSEPKTIVVSGDQTVIHDATPILGSTTEDSASEQTLSGQMHVTDADTNDHPVFTQQQGTHGTYGTFGIDVDGNWQYALDNSLSTTQQLVSGHVAHEIFTVEVTTDSGETVTQMVQVNVTGTNDAPTVSTGIVLSAGTEDTDITLTSTQLLANAADVDTGELAQLSIHDLQADHGSVTDNGDGTFTFHPDANYNGEVHFTYDVQDPQGGSVSTSATMDLAAVNDSALISGALTGGVKEDQNLNHHAGDPLDGFMNTSGKLTVSDVDSGEDHFQLQLGAAGDNGYGVFTVAPSGAWIYYADPKQIAIQELGEGRTLTDTITVTSADGTTQQITVTITGTNDAPTVSADTMAHAVDLGSSDLGQPVHFSESDLLSLIGAADVDTSDTLSISAVTIDAAVGSFAKDAVSGDWVFTPVGGASATDAQVQITVTDGTTPTTAQATLDVVPPPPLAISTITSDTGSSSTDFITSDNSLVISGTGTPGDTVRVMDGPFTSLGTAVVDATGQWSIDHTGSTLRDGTHHIMVLGKNPDGSAGTIEQPLVIDTGMPTITIEPVGQDDVLDSSDQGKPLTISGAVTHVDDGNTVTIDIAGKTYTGIVQAGTWSVTVPTADADALQDQNLLIHAHVETTAGTPAEADHHLIVSASPDTLRASGQLQEDVTVTDGGQVFRLNGDGTVDTPTSMDGNFGTLIVDASGQYHYQLNNNAPEIQALGQGESVSDHFLIPITLADGSHRMAQVDFDIAGTNDAPTITGGLSAERSVHTTATTHMSTTGQVVINDVDTHDTLSLTINGQQVDLSAGTAKIDTAVGQLAIRPDGNWEYMLDKGGPERDQLNSLLNTGGSQQERFHMVVTDSHGESRVADIVVTIAGDAGNPTLRGTLRAAVVEDATLEADGVLNVVDANGVKQTGVTGWTIDASHSGTYGAFSIDAQGHWHYTLNNANPAVQALAGGEQLTDHATITATDANGQPISRVIDVDITGTNDAPVISGDHIGNTAEDATASISGKLLASDVDSTDSVAFTAETLAGGFGSLTIDADGHWTYQIDNTLLATQSLNAGQTEPDTFEVTATSTDGTSIKRIITINITGREDAPVIAGSHTGNVTEDATTMTLSGDLTATDADLGDIPAFQAMTSQQGTYGSLTLDASGHWTYTLDSSLPATQALAGGESQPDTFTVTARTADGETVTQDITVTVTGTNDAPTLTATDTAHAVDLGATDEDTAKTFTEAELLQMVGASDADSGDTLHVTAVTSPHGTFTHDATSGDWTFTPAADYHGDDVAVTLTVNDGHTDVTAHGTIDVSSVTDLPTPDLTITAEQQVMEFAPHTASGVVNTNPISAGGAITELTIDMTVLGGQQVASSGGHGATLISYAVPSDSNAMYVWNDAPGKDLTFRVGGQEYATGVAMMNDGDDHRYSFSWDGQAGTLDVLIDGQLVKHMDNVGQGATIADGGKFALGNDQDSFGGGFSVNDGFTGQLFNAAVAKTALDPAQLATANTGELLDGSADLLVNILAQNGQFVDATGNTQVQTVGRVTVSTVMVDTAVASPNPGALLHLDLDAGAPTDTDDTITHQELSGFPAGTMLTDGHGHSVTITDPTISVDVQGWTLSSLTAQLPTGSTANMRIIASVTTEGPDGAVETATSDAAVVIDPTQAVPLPPGSGTTDVGTTDVNLGLNPDPMTGRAPDPTLDPTGTATQTVNNQQDLGFVAYTGQAAGSDMTGLDGHGDVPTGNYDDAPPIRVELVDDTGNQTDLITSNGQMNFLEQRVGASLQFSTDGGQTWTDSYMPHEGENSFQVRQITPEGLASQPTSFNFTLDTQVGNLVVNVADPGADNLYETTELTASGKVAVTIQLPAEAMVGDTLTINGVAQVLTAQDIAAGAVSNEIDSGTTLNAVLTDAAGNTSPLATATVADAQLSSISIDSVDNSLEVQTSTSGGHQIHGANHPGNSDKFTPTAFETTSGDVTIHGSATGLTDGTQVTVHLQDTLNPTNSFDLVGTVSSGQWRVTIDHTRVDNVGDHDWQVEATATDANGTVVHATTEIIDQGALTQHLTEGGTTTSLDLLEGADGMAVSNLLYSLDGQNYSNTIPAGFRLDADGHSLEVDPDNAAFNSLAEGAQQTVYVKYQLSETVNGTQETINQNAVITVTGTNDAPVVTATNSAPVDLGATDEDTAKTFTEADLLHLVGAHDTDTADTLHVSSVNIDPSVGSFTHDSATGAWTFTPAANFDGSHLPVSIEISDGTDTTTAHAAINVTPVADTPTLDISLGSIALSADVPLATQVGVSAGPNFEGSVFVDFGGMYGTPVLFGDPAELAHVQGILAGGTMISLGAAVHDPVHGDGVQLPGAEACRAFVDNDGSGSVKMIFDSDAPAQMHFAVYYSGVEDWIGDFANWGDFSIDRTPASGGPSHDFSAIMPEDSVLPLTLTIGDADNSEQLSVTISGVPAGASLNAGTDNHDGSWTLQPSDLTGLQLTPAANWNGEIQLGITVTSTDGTSHAETTSNLKISVTPVEDLSTVSGEDHLDVTEGTASPGAALIIQDPDTPAATFINVDHQQGDQGYGEFSMRDGHWTFEPGPKATALPDGAHATDTVTFRTTDGAEHQVVVNITGADTESHISGTLQYGMGKGIGEEFSGTEQAYGSLTVVDPDTGSVQPTLPEFTGQVGDHGYGHFSMQGGQWTYLIDAAAVAPVKPDEIVYDTLTVHASDGSEAVITIKIFGGNSAPTVSGSVHLPNLGDESPVTITEAQLLSHASDIDLAASESLIVSGVTVDHGSITHPSVGTWIFTPETGYTGSVQFSYQVEDRHHGITQASADLTIVDNDLVPTVTATDSAHAADLGNTAEDTTMTFTEADLLAKVGAHDSDATDTLSISDITSPHGTFTKLASGEWEFTPEANYHGDDVAVSIQVSDGRLATTAQALIDISSVTDAPIISASVTGISAITRQVETPVQGLVETATGTTDTPLNYLYLEAYGTEGLLGNTVAFTVPSGVDNHCITGLLIDGQLVSGDPVYCGLTAPANQDTVVFPELDVATFMNAQNITFQFADNAPAALDIKISYDWAAVGWSETEIGSFMEEAGSLHIDRHGTVMEMRDIDVFASPEDAPISLDIDVQASVADDQLVSIVMTGMPDGATLSAGTHNADGSWTLAPADLAGLTLTPAQDWRGDIDLQIVAKTSDGTQEAEQSSTLSVTVAPVADVPTVTVTPVSGDEDSNFALDIKLGGHFDAHESQSIEISGIPVGSSLSAGTLRADGVWVLTPQELPNLSLTLPKDYETSLTLDVKGVATDEGGVKSSQTVQMSVDVNPLEDAPDIRLTSTPDFNEDTSYTFQPSDFGFHDVDSADSLHHVTLTQLPASGALLLNGQAVTAGQQIDAADIPHLVFQPTQDFHGQLSLGFTVNDGQLDSAESVMRLDVNNVNDAATFTGDKTGSMTDDKDALATISGQLTVHDIDSDHRITVHSYTGVETYQGSNGWGSLKIDQDGNWEYTLNDHTMELPEGKVVTDSVTVHSVDGTPQVITVTITGTNQAPIVRDVHLPDETSGTPFTISEAALLANVHDVDLQAGEELTVHNLQAGASSIVDNGDGTFTITPSHGYTGELQLFFDVQDPQGGTTPALATLDIVAPDTTAPVSSNDTVASQSVVEDQSVIDEHGGHFLGAAGVVSTDADGQAISFVGQTVTGDHGGSLLMTQLGGVWQARIDNDSPEVQALNTGESFVETFTVTDTDGNTHDIKITVEGTDEGAQVNPAPPASDESAGTLVEEAAPISSDEPVSAISDYMQFAVTIDSAELAGVGDSLSGSSDADSGALSGYLDVVGASSSDLIEPVVMDPAQEASADDVLASQADSVNPDDGSTQNDVDSLPVDMAQTTPDHQDVQVDV